LHKLKVDTVALDWTSRDQKDRCNGFVNNSIIKLI